MSAAAPEVASERERDAARKAESRARAKDLRIPPCANPERRAACEKDIFLALETYFPTRCKTWTDSRRQMVNAIFEAMRDGTSQAMAAPRGDGKTTITECVVILCILYGWLRFVVILAQTDKFAKRRMKSIKRQLTTNELLIEDFPEVCVPARDVAPSPNRAGNQTAGGELTYIEWSAEHVVLPTIPGSVSSGSVIYSDGITASLRGMNENGLRPDLVIIDDPDDQESANSDAKTLARVQKINASIEGLVEDGESLAIVMLCTIINRTCAAYQFTDREQNPEWMGLRLKALPDMPTRMDLWETYILLRKEDMHAGDKWARRAHQFYIDNREEMDAGATVSNPTAYDSRTLTDGSDRELSRLQYLFNRIAKIGWAAFHSEYQNDPLAESGPQDSGITEAIVAGTDPEYAGRVNGRERLIAPDSTRCVTGFIDIRRRELHWTLIAWSAGLRGTVVDYGVTATHQPDVVGIEKAILEGLRKLRDMFAEEPVVTGDGEACPLSTCLVDCGYMPDAIYRFCAESGQPYYPAMGDPRFKRPTKRTPEKSPGGDWWYWSHQSSESVPSIWVVNHFPDAWKHSLHEMLLAKPLADDGLQPPNTLTLWGDTARDHLPYADQVCAEIWTTEFKEGKGERSYWRAKRKDNHWLDTTCGCLIGADIMGEQSDRPVELQPRRTRRSGQSMPLPGFVSSPGARLGG